MNKKLMTIVAAGAFVVGGIGAFWTNSSYAADKDNNMMPPPPPPSCRCNCHCNCQPEHQQMDSQKVADVLAENFGVDKTGVKEYLDNGGKMHDASHAAMLSKASNKSFNDVIALKNEKKHWKDVEKELGITQEQMKTMFDDMKKNGQLDMVMFAPGHKPHHGFGPMDHQMAPEMLTKDFGIDQAELKEYLDNGGKMHDASHAAILSKVSGKSFKDIIALKSEKKHWKEVEDELGVTHEQIKDLCDEMRKSKDKEANK